MTGLRRWDPFLDNFSLRKEIDRLFEDNLGPITAPFSDRVAVDWVPAVDIAETEDALHVKAELPGLKQEDVDIHVQGDTLTIKGERKYEHEEKKKNYLRKETTYGSFQRAFSLGVPVKTDAVTATYKNGVLEITLPKVEEVKPKQVKIKVE